MNFVGRKDPLDAIAGMNPQLIGQKGQSLYVPRPYSGRPQWLASFQRILPVGQLK